MSPFSGEVTAILCGQLEHSAVFFSLERFLSLKKYEMSCLSDLWNDTKIAQPTQYILFELL